MLHREDWRELSLRTVKAFGPQLKRDPSTLPQMLASAGWLEGSPRQILIQGEPSASETHQLIAEVWQRFLPRHVLIRIDSQSRPFFESRVQFIGALPMVTGKAAIAYVCENFACQLPTSDPAVLATQLDHPDNPNR